jgi:hypothetical protein
VSRARSTRSTGDRIDRGINDLLWLLCSRITWSQRIGKLQTCIPQITPKSIALRSHVRLNPFRQVVEGTGLLGHTKATVTGDPHDALNEKALAAGGIHCSFQRLL